MFQPADHHRWEDASEEEIRKLIEKKTPKNTKINKKSQWNQFMEFCTSRGIKLTLRTTVLEIARKEKE